MSRRSNVVVLALLLAAALVWAGALLVGTGRLG